MSRLMVFLAVFVTMVLNSCAAYDVADAPENQDRAAGRGPNLDAVLRLLAAKRAERRGDSAGALSEWEAAVRADTSSPALRLGLARTYLGQSNDSMAVMNARKSVLLDSGFVDGQLFLASIYENRNDFAGAIRHLEVAFRHSHAPETGWRLAGLYARLAKPEESRRVFQTMADAPASRPDDLLAWAEQAEMSPVKGASDLFYRTYLRRWEGAEDGAVAYAEYLGKSGRRAEAERFLRTWLARRPDSREVSRQFIQLLVAQEKWVDADSVWARVGSQTPDDLIQFKGWVTYLVKRGQIRLAISNAERLISSDPEDGDGYVLLGQAHAAHGELDAAIRAFKEAVRRDPSLEAYSELVYSQASLRLFSEAEQTSRNALRRYPDDERLLSLLSASLMAQKKWREAVPVLRSLVQNDTTDADRLFDLGTSLERAGAFDSSVVVFRRLLSANPHHADGLNYLGFMFADKNVRLSEAETLLSEALRLEPRNAAFLDSMGWLRYRQRRYQEAKENLLSAIEIDGSVAEIHEHLGDVLLALGDREGAREGYRSALGLDPTNSRIERKLRALQR